MTGVESALLLWLVVGIGIVAGVFIVARAAVQIGEVVYQLVEKRIDARAATQQGVLLTLGMILAGLAAAFIAATAIAFFIGMLLEGAPLE